MKSPPPPKKGLRNLINTNYSVLHYICGNVFYLSPLCFTQQSIDIVSIEMNSMFPKSSIPNHMSDHTQIHTNPVPFHYSFRDYPSRINRNYTPVTRQKCNSIERHWSKKWDQTKIVFLFSVSKHGTLTNDFHRFRTTGMVGTDKLDKLIVQQTNKNSSLY